MIKRIFDFFFIFMMGFLLISGGILAQDFKYEVGEDLDNEEEVYDYPEPNFDLWPDQEFIIDYKSPGLEKGAILRIYYGDHCLRTEVNSVKEEDEVIPAVIYLFQKDEVENINYQVETRIIVDKNGVPVKKLDEESGLPLKDEEGNYIYQKIPNKECDVHNPMTSPQDIKNKILDFFNILKDNH